jgi:hypothetical protein
MKMKGWLTTVVIGLAFGCKQQRNGRRRVRSGRECGKGKSNVIDRENRGVTDGDNICANEATTETGNTGCRTSRENTRNVGTELPSTGRETETKGGVRTAQRDVNSHEHREWRRDDIKGWSSDRQRDVRQRITRRERGNKDTSVGRAFMKREIVETFVKYYIACGPNTKGSKVVVENVTKGLRVTQENTLASVVVKFAWARGTRDSVNTASKGP